MKSIKRLIKSYWYGFLMKYHGDKSLKIATVCNKQNTAFKFHQDMMGYYYKKVESL